ncbi:hypothetical protein Gasu2_35990 [Galdieria sulphuraria]|nr:hypothetical protein Gasu2_35990 [Galdieria sulphuraria]
MEDILFDENKEMEAQGINYAFVEDLFLSNFSNTCYLGEVATRKTPPFGESTIVAVAGVAWNTVMLIKKVKIVLFYCACVKVQSVVFLLHQYYSDDSLYKNLTLSSTLS